ILEPPFSEKCLAASRYLLRRRGIDNVVVICGDLVVQALRGMGEQVSVLVDRAALHRNAVPDGCNGFVEPWCAIDDEELGTPQPTLDEIVQRRAPCLGAFAAHALDREQDLLAIGAYAQHNEQ